MTTPDTAPSLEFDAVRSYLASLPPAACAALFAVCCDRLVFMYEKEGEPSEAPGQAVASLQQLANGRQPDVSDITECLGLLDELLDVFREAEDDLMVHSLATFKYALCAVQPPSDSPDPHLWGARCVSSVMSTIGALHHCRGGQADWEASEAGWLLHALERLSSDVPSLSALYELEPRVPLWQQELVARGVW